MISSCELCGKPSFRNTFIGSQANQYDVGSGHLKEDFVPMIPTDSLEKWSSIAITIVNLSIRFKNKVNM